MPWSCAYVPVCLIGSRFGRLGCDMLPYFWFASFCVAKGCKLQAKRTPFAVWNVLFCNALIVRVLWSMCGWLWMLAFCRWSPYAFLYSEYVVCAFLLAVVLCCISRLAVFAFSLRIRSLFILLILYFAPEYYCLLCVPSLIAAFCEECWALCAVGLA